MEYPSIFVSLGAWNWLILGGLLIILELMVPGFFLIFFGLAAAVVGLVALAVEISWQVQCLLFAALSLGGVLFARKFWVHDSEASDNPLLNRRAAQYVGHSYTLEQAIKNGRGKIRIGDTLWTVEGPDLPADSQITVISAGTITLQVEAKT